MPLPVSAADLGENVDFGPPFWIYVDDEEYLNYLRNLVFNQGLYIYSFFKNRSKIWPLKDHRFFDIMAAVTS